MKRLSRTGRDFATSPQNGSATEGQERRRRPRLMVLGLWAALVFLPAGLLQAGEVFRRGDANADARVDLSDAVFTLSFLFTGGQPPSCHDAVDTNDDGALDVSDALYTLLYLFSGAQEPPAPGSRCGVDPTEDVLACASFAPCFNGDGRTEFSSPLAGAPGIFLGRAEDVAEAGPPAPPAPEAKDGEQARLIEESDIYKLEGSTLFVLNRYRGLQVVDLADLDRPRQVGHAPIFGYPREMYVRESRAYVIVSDYYSYWRDESVTVPPHGFYGSQLRIIDIADPSRPRVLGGINVRGDVADSRIVGDVMYLVSNRYPWYGGYGTGDTEDKTQVLSIDIRDPADVHAVDTRDFPRQGWEHHLHVTAQAIYLAASGAVWTNGSGWRYGTRVQYIDISDPTGLIALRGQAEVDGRVQDRWSMDEYEGVLRVASGQNWGNGDVHLTTFSVVEPDRIEQLGRFTLHVNEQLTSARFDGSRGYLVTYRNIDPLFVFDLTEASTPRLLGELEMTGWLDFMVPMGDRLVALGHEDIVLPDGGRDISLAASLIDVGPVGPRLLSRVTLDGVWGWVPGNHDELAKVFRVLPEQDLILFPFQAWSKEDYAYVGGVQLIDFSRDALTLRGLIRDAGWVERGVAFGEETVLTLSSTLLQVADIADRNQPRVRGRLELARNVQDFDLLPGDHAVQLAGDWYLGSTELIVTTAEAPDDPEPVSRIKVPSPYGRMFRNGNFVYLASMKDVTDEKGVVIGQVTVVEVVDFTDPGEPRRRGSVTLPEEVWVGYGRWYWGWGDEAVLVGQTTLAFHRYPAYYWWDCLACDGREAGPTPVGDYTTEHRIHLVDLADPDLPVVASTVVLKDDDWAWGLKAFGTTLYLSSYRSFLDQDRWMAKYFLRRIEVGDPASPVVNPPVNIPGMLVAAEPGTPYIYTYETWWEYNSGKTWSLVHALAVDGDTAILQSTVVVDGSLNSVLFKERALFATSYRWAYVNVDSVQVFRAYSELLTVEVSDPRALRIAARVEVPQTDVYLQEVEDGHAFLGSGIGIFTYHVGDINRPTFDQFFRTHGWTQKIVVRGGKAFLPSGYYGVQVLDLEGTGIE